MLGRKIFQCLLIALVMMGVSLPGQAGMVTTAQIQSSPMVLDSAVIAEQRQWLQQQLVTGGVNAKDAKIRVAAMTDAQIHQIHQRIDEEPAGGNIVIVVLIALVITDVLGYTDIFPFIRPAD